MKEKAYLAPLPRLVSPAKGFRRTLPNSEQKPIDSYSIWEIIKPNIGKVVDADFSKFSVPVFMNEPISFLERVAENLQYHEMLDAAAVHPDPLERMMLVSSYAVSALSSNWNRVSKPYNPLLLETYELERDGVRYLAEQVSHHPPVSAVYAESDNFVIQASVTPKISFGMNKLICAPGARFKVFLKKYNETYLYDGPGCNVYNIMLGGKMYMNVTGTMSIRCESSGYDTVLSFDAGRGWHIKTTDVHVDGYVMQGKTKVRALYGNWSYYLATCSVESFKHCHSSYQKTFMESLHPGNEQHAALIPDSRILWTAYRLPDGYDKLFNFSFFTMSLNELKPEMRDLLPPTDCRFRQDMAAHENGQIDEAEKKKHKLEEVQRSRRKLNTGQVARWFKKDGADWVFTGEYFKRDWKECTDIFSMGRSSSEPSDHSPSTMRSVQLSTTSKE